MNDFKISCIVALCCQPDIMLGISFLIAEVQEGNMIVNGPRRDPHVKRRAEWLERQGACLKYNKTSPSMLGQLYTNVHENTIFACVISDGRDVSQNNTTCAFGAWAVCGVSRKRPTFAPQFTAELMLSTNAFRCRPNIGILREPHLLAAKLRIFSGGERKRERSIKRACVGWGG
jgi:hypothetical protein